MLYEGAETYGSFPYRPKRDAWWFTGWYTASEGGTRVFESSAPTKGETLYAHWQMNVGSSRTAFYADKPCFFSRQGVERWFAQTNFVVYGRSAVQSGALPQRGDLGEEDVDVFMIDWLPQYLPRSGERLKDEQH